MFCRVFSRSRWFLFLVVIVAAGTALPQEDASTPTGCDDAGTNVSDIEQDEPQVYVRVAVDRESRQYAAGDQIAITVRAGIDSYLYVFYEQADK
jgi:hypothetical protein